MDFTDRCTTALALDTHKRVLYTHGLVLGVGEFKTEQHYFLEKHRGHNRHLHGYGTVAGLAIQVRDTPTGPEVRVDPGLAIDAHGREICVSEPQCAQLNDWLLQRRERGEPSPPDDDSPPPTLETYVVLCYRECETDKVPIPIGPCYSLDKTTAASRIQEAFELRLLDRPPPQIEEDALRLLGAILSHVRIDSTPGALTTPDVLLDQIRALAPGGSPPDVELSPPSDLVLDPAHADEIVRTALRVFVTEVRPRFVFEGGGCLKGPRDETCVLLAKLRFEVEDLSGIPQVTGEVDIDERDRPFLLQTRALQEWWFNVMKQTAAVAVDGSPPSGSPPDAPAKERTIAFGPGTLIPIKDAANAMVAETVPALRFRADGEAASVFSASDLAPSVPPRVRLQWAFQGPEVVPSIQWEVRFRVREANEDFFTPTPAAANTTFNPSVILADQGHLLVTHFAELSLPVAPPVPELGHLLIQLRSAEPLDELTEVFLVLVELIYTAQETLA